MFKRRSIGLLIGMGAVLLLFGVAASLTTISFDGDVANAAQTQRARPNQQIAGVALPPAQPVALASQRETAPQDALAQIAPSDAHADATTRQWVQEVVQTMHTAFNRADDPVTMVQEPQFTRHEDGSVTGDVMVRTASSVQSVPFVVDTSATTPRISLIQPGLSSGTQFAAPDDVAQDDAAPVANDAAAQDIVLRGTGGDDALTIANSGQPVNAPLLPEQPAADQTFTIQVGDVISDTAPGNGSGRIENPGDRDIYNFSVTNGQTIVFDLQAESAGFWWSLYDPNTNEVFSYWTGDRKHTLAPGGTYQLIVEGYNADDTGTYQFRLWDVRDPDEFNINVGDTVSEGIPGAGAGNIETKGVADVYRFNATAGQTIVFDDQGRDSTGSFWWTLTGPGNIEIFDYWFGDRKHTLDVAGQYTLTVIGGNLDTFGTYQFQLLNVPDPQIFPIAVGDVVQQDVPSTGAAHIETKGVTDVYEFDAFAGQTLTFDEQGRNSNGNFWWRLEDPLGVEVFDYWFGDRKHTLDITGKYTLTVIGGNLDTTGTYQFQIWDVPQPPPVAINVGDTITLDDPVTGAGHIEIKGEIDTYTFDGYEGQQVWFKDLDRNSNGNFWWTLTNPENQQLFAYWFGSRVVELPRTGVYTLGVSGGVLDTTGTYSFRLYSETPNDDIENAFIVSSLPYTHRMPTFWATTSGDPASCGSNVTHTVWYEFRLAQADAAILETTGSTFNTVLAVYEGEPGNLQQVACNDDGQGSLQSYLVLGAQTGKRYFIMIGGDNGDAGNLVFTASTQSKPTLTPSNTPDLTPTVTPSFTPTFTPEPTDGPPPTFTPTSTPQPGQVFPIRVGDVVLENQPNPGAGHIEDPGSRDVYVFEGRRGQTIVFDLQEESASMWWSLYDPYGQEIFDYWTSDRKHTLPHDGTYQLVVKHNNDTDTGTYQFRLWDVPLPERFDIQIGQRVANGVPYPGAGNIETKGTSDIYNFYAYEGQTIVFDDQGRDSNGNFWWTLTGPSGIEVFDYWFGDRNHDLEGYFEPFVADNVQLHAGDDGGIDRVTMTESGLYTLQVIGGNLDTTGNYEFTLWDVRDTDVFPLAVGDRVENGLPGAGAGNIERKGVMDTYQFDVFAGQTIVFDDQGRTSNGNFWWRLEDPLGVEIFDYWFGDRMHTFSTAGTYTLTVVGGNLDTTGTYSFQLWHVPPADTFPIQVGDTVALDDPAAGAGHIETKGVTDTYTFEAFTGQRVVFDEQGRNSNGNFWWTLRDPEGEQIFAYWFGDREHILQRTGTYTLSVIGGNLDTTGTYQFEIYSETPNDEIDGAEIVASLPYTHRMPTFWATSNNDDPTPACASNVGNTVWYEFRRAEPGTTFMETTGSTFDTVIAVYEGTPDNLQPLACNDNALNAQQSYLSFFPVPGVTYYVMVGGNNGDTGNLIFTASTALQPTLTPSVTPQLTATATPIRFTATPQPTDGPPPPSLTPVPGDTYDIAIGDVVSEGQPNIGAGHIEEPGGRDVYRFYAEAGQDLIFDLQEESASLWWTLYAPNGYASFDYWTSDHRHIMPRTGIYQLVVRGSNATTTGTYQFRIWDVPPPERFDIQVSQRVANDVPYPGAGNIETKGAQDNYTFYAHKGQTVIFDDQGRDSNGNFWWWLTDANGEEIFDYWFGDRRHDLANNDPALQTARALQIASETGHMPDANNAADDWHDGPIQVMIPEGGWYTLHVKGGNLDTTGTYEFVVWDVRDPDYFPIVIGDTVAEGAPGAGAGHIERKGVADVYHFSAEAGQTVVFDDQGRTSNGNFWWTLHDPNNNEVFDYWFGDQKHTLDVAGDYTLTIYGGNLDTTGTYQFKLWNVPDNDTFAIAIGDRIEDGVPGVGAGRIETKGVIDEYTFYAAAGDTILFDNQGRDSNGNFWWWMRDPRGDETFAYWFGDRTETLPETGTYTLRVQGGDLDTTGSYNFQLVSAANNDDFDDALIVSSLPYTHRLPTGLATEANDDPLPSCETNTGKTVWYIFTSATDNRYILETPDSNYDTVVSVYTGTRGNLTEVACNEDDPAGGQQSYLEFDAVAGTTYYVMVGGRSDTGGYLKFRVRDADAPFTEPDLRAIAFDAAPDNALQGQTSVTFTIENAGDDDSQGYAVEIRHSLDAVCDASDTLLATVNFGPLFGNDTINHTEAVQMDTYHLYQRAAAATPLNGSQSTHAEYLCLLVDSANSVIETDEGNNSNLGKGTDMDDFTYFPWDTNGDNVADINDLQAILNELGTVVARSELDVDSDRVVTPRDVITALNRTAIAINAAVFEN